MINMSSATDTTALTIDPRTKTSERSAGEYVAALPNRFPSPLSGKQ